ncbi:DUF5000 domain-containing lipoprotein [bacterium]|nr:DUF5000 domain-containing lipoprotein [bacterium]
MVKIINTIKQEMVKINICTRYLLICVLLILGCSEEERGAYGSDEIPPDAVEINSVENKPGGAIIKFTPPTNEDLLYIRGAYSDENGISKQVIVSSVIDTLSIIGFGQTGDYNVDVTAIDTSDNESVAVTTTISPLEAPIHAILESIEGAQDFGGINISYLNPTRAEVSLNMSILDQDGNQVFKESFYTSQANSSYSFRGYDPIPTTFIIYVEDRWGNKSITKTLESTPLEDVFLDKGFFSIQQMPGDESFSEYGFSANQMWDGSWSSQWNCGHTNFLALPHQLTINLGQLAKLNRFKLYQRGGTELYKHGNPKRFQIYGRENLDNLPIYSPSNPGDGWILLGEFESFKPSGLPPGSNTEEDYLFQDNGEDFVFDSNIQQYNIQYIRFVNLETWNNQMVSVIGELSFWGSVD